MPENNKPNTPYTPPTLPKPTPPTPPKPNLPLNEGWDRPFSEKRTGKPVIPPGKPPGSNNRGGDE